MVLWSGPHPRRVCLGCKRVTRCCAMHRCAVKPPQLFGPTAARFVAAQPLQPKAFSGRRPGWLKPSRAAQLWARDAEGHPNIALDDAHAPLRPSAWGSVSSARHSILKLRIQRVIARWHPMYSTSSRYPTRHDHVSLSCPLLPCAMLNTPSVTVAFLARNSTPIASYSEQE